MKKIAVFTGTRAEYGLLFPVMRAIQDQPDLQLHLIAGGMHLDTDFGKTFTRIKEDGFKVEGTISMSPEDDSSHAMAKSIGLGIEAAADLFRELHPDLLLLLGDRTEALAATIAAVYMNIIVAHIHGGDRSRAGLDESARHAISKFAHIHFPATEQSRQRLIRLGEDPNRIFLTGAPGLDTVLHARLPEPHAVAKKFGVKTGKYFLVLNHPVTTEPERARAQMLELIEALKTLKETALIVYSNNDAGGRAILDVIKNQADMPFLRSYPSIAHQDFLALMRDCQMMIGNSSSGIIESTAFGVPVVNLGIRQQNRERGNNVVDSRYRRAAILEAVARADSQEFRNQISPESPYGDGQAGLRIARTLARLSLDSSLLQKQITY